VYARREDEEHHADSEEGAFVLSGLEEGLYDIKAIDKRFFETVQASGVAAGTEDLVLRFPPGGQIRVRCRDKTGASVECVSLAIAERTVGQDEGSGLFHSEQQTRASGVFMLDQVPAGRRQLWIHRAGYRSLGPFDVSIEVGKTTALEVSFDHPLPVLRVVVSEPDGRPVADCAVSVYTPNQPEPVISGEWTRWGPKHRTGADGRYAVNLDASGEVDVVLHDWGSNKTAPTFAMRHLVVPATGEVTARFAVTPRLMVCALREDSRCHAAGLRDGDIILEWGSRPLRTPESVPTRWTDPVRLLVSRGGQTRAIQLPPGTLDFDTTRVLLPPP
jgi:hypothetical protein